MAAIAPTADLELPHPDVAELDRGAMPLQLDRPFFRMGFRIVRKRLVEGRSVDGLVVVDDHSIVDHGDGRWLLHSVFAIDRWIENDVVALPFAFRLTRVHEWWRLAVDSARHAVGVRDVLVALEHLDLVEVHQIDAAVAIGRGSLWYAPFDVKLALTEALLGLGVGSRCDHQTILDFPRRGERIGIEPIEENNRIFWRGLEDGAAGLDLGRLWTLHVVHFVLAPRLFRRGGAEGGGSKGECCDENGSFHGGLDHDLNEVVRQILIASTAGSVFIGGRWLTGIWNARRW